MPSVFDVYTFYLERETLRGRSVVVHIERAEVEQVFNPRTKHDDLGLVVHFHDKKLALCCNKTQAGALVDITDTDDFAKWAGHTVTLTRHGLTADARRSRSPRHRQQPTAAGAGRTHIQLGAGIGLDIGCSCRRRREVRRRHRRRG